MGQLALGLLDLGHQFQHLFARHPASPGRHEIDETQELCYPAIMRAIADLRFDGYVGQEFVPSQGRDPIASLEQAIRICDV